MSPLVFHLIRCRLSSGLERQLIPPTVKFLTFVIPRLDKIAQEVNHFTRDDGWIMANRAHNSLGLKHRGAVLKAMRHALTGQMVSEGVSLGRSMADCAAART